MEGRRHLGIKHDAECDITIGLVVRNVCEERMCRNWTLMVKTLGKQTEQRKASTASDPSLLLSLVVLEGALAKTLGYSGQSMERLESARQRRSRLQCESSQGSR